LPYALSPATTATRPLSVREPTAGWAPRPAPGVRRNIWADCNAMATTWIRTPQFS